MRYLLVFDLDGCLYDENILPDQGFFRLCDEANALAAREICPELSYEEAVELAAKSYREYHDCYGAFVEHAQRAFGYDPLTTKRALFKRYHANLFGLLEERHPKFFDHTASTAEAFSRLSGGPFAHAILSHSCMEGWGKPVLAKIGILEHFEPHLLLGMDDYGFKRKFESAEPMRQLIDASGYPAERIIFAEDTFRNTQPASLQLGIKIALIHHNATPSEQQLAAVQWAYRTPAALLNALEKEYATGLDLNKRSSSLPAAPRPL